MEANDNPYTPNAGARPPALVGRDAQLRAFEVLLDRLRRGHAEQSMLVTGLRGVGKTVLLGALEERARARNWTTIEAEITKSAPFGPRMAQLVRRALLQLAPKTTWRKRTQRAAAILKSFQMTVSSEGELTFGLDVDAAEGVADSGSLSDDLTDLLVALGEAAKEQDRGVVFLFDEVQFLAAADMEALIAALHKTVQRQLPITLVGAGLPQLPRLAGEARSYSERLFQFPVLGPLDPAEAARALAEPARALGVEYVPGAVDAIVRYTQGYPYFLQEFGKLVWDHADASPITLQNCKDTAEAVEAKLDTGFFRARIDRASQRELQYLRAMAELGREPQAAKDVARIMGRTSEQLAPTRARLIDKGLLYAPSHGLAAFTVPQFDRYMRRAHALEVPHT